MERKDVVIDVNKKNTTESYEKSLFEGIKSNASEGFANLKKLGRFIYNSEIEGQALRDAREGIENVTKGLYNIIKEAPRNLTDKEWYSRNKYYIGSMAIPVGLSIVIGALSTTNHIKLDEIFRRSSFVANKLSDGLMVTYGSNAVDLVNLGSSIPYQSTSIADEISLIYGTRPLSFAENAQVWWHNNGGAYLEHVIPWTSWGAGATAVKHRENKNKKT